MFNSVLYFGRKDCFYSSKIREFLKKSSKKFYYIESDFKNKKINKKIINNLSIDYIFCFRSFYILKGDLIKKTRVAAINFHPGPPEYRGIGCINYALYDNSKFYGCTSHVINKKIDDGKILDVRRFRIKKTDTVESCLKKTYDLVLKQAYYVINSLNNKDENLMKLIKKSKLEKWSKKIKKQKDLNKFYEIKKNLSKKMFIRKFRATNTTIFKPYILLHKKRFILSDEEKQKKILIIGSGEHSKVILSEIIQIKGYKIIGFIDDDLKKGTLIETYKNKQYKILGDIKGLKKIIDKNTFGIIGVGSNFLRKNIFEKINKICKNFNWETIISKNSTINGDVKIGKGSIIISGSIINNGTKIGEHCLINTSSSIDHNNIIKNFSSTGPSVTTGGNVELGQCSHLGIGSTIKNQISIGDNTIIGARSLVLKNCEKNSVYYGIPAKKIRDRKYNSEYL